MIETLFFFCYYSYIRGDLKTTDMYYSLLREEFKNVGRKDSLESHQYTKLKKVRDALRTGYISKNSWIDTAECPVTISEVTLKQVELVKRIHKEGLEQLRDILKDKVEIYNIEQPCNPYGFVDMVYEGAETIYPVEVKRGRGEHDLIGQIKKYDLYHRLRLHYKMYKYVQPITICGSYSVSINELKQIGVLTLLYSITNNKIKIKKI